MDRPFTVIDCEQRTSEWWQARCGRLTASEASILFAKAKKGADESVQRRDLRVRLALENLTGQASEGDELNGADVRRGRELEPEARAAYEVQTGRLVDTVGFLRHEALPIGCSPDGIVGDWEGGLELKAPKPAIHYGYLTRPGSLVADYQAQVLHSLFVTGLPWWDIAAYCPQFPESHRLHVERVTRESVDLTAYELTLRLFLDEVAKEEQAIRVLLARREAVAA